MAELTAEWGVKKIDELLNNMNLHVAIYIYMKLYV